jgi:hypothetical protein
MRLGRRIAFFLGVLPGSPSPGIADLLWDARGKQARCYWLLGAYQERWFEDIQLCSRQPTGSLHWGDTVRHHCQQRRLLVEPTDKIRLGGGDLGQGFALEISSIKKKQIPCVGASYDSIDLFLIRNVPGGEGKMGADTVCVIPHELHFCPGWWGTPSGAREGVFQTVW